MPNIIGPDGLEVATQAELIAQFTSDMQAIYGADINLDQDSPDGQMMLIFIQAVLDLEDLLVQVNNMFDPDLAIGKILDQRVAINGIQRQAGTYSITNITLIASQALTLNGLDQDTNEVFTVADNAGTKWVLITSQVISAPGTHVYPFRALNPGATLSTPNSITVPVTIVLGITSINNPTVLTSTGLNEESDAALKIRRQKSVSLASQGYLKGLIAALENISGVGSVFVYENNTGSTDMDGVPSHSIWVIVSGTGADSEIAQAIYNKRNAGCGMFGSISYAITQVDGTEFLVLWDMVTAEDLFIKFTVSSLDGINAPNVEAIRQGLVTSFAPGVFEQVNVNDLATQVQLIDNNALVTNAGFSLTSGGSYTVTLSPSTKDKQFAVTRDNIIIIPILVTPSVASVVSLGTQQFQAFGGFGSYTWSMHTSGSGSPGVSGSGLYTAGSGTGLDVVRVTDSIGNFTDVNITVSA